MSANTTIVLAGTVRNGVVVPDGDLPLPEGARVGIGLPISEVDPELSAELAAWDRAGDEAWGMLAAWEAEHGH